MTKALQRKVRTPNGEIMTKKEWVERLFKENPNLKTEKSEVYTGKVWKESWFIGDWEANKSEIDYYNYLVKS